MDDPQQQQRVEPSQMVTNTQMTIDSSQPLQINLDTYGLDFYNRSDDLEVSTITARRFSNIYSNQMFNHVDVSEKRASTNPAEIDPPTTPVTINEPEETTLNESPTTPGKSKNEKKSRFKELGRKLAEFNRKNRGLITRKKTSKSKRAGCIFPVTRVLTQLKAMYPTKRVGEGAAVYLTAVLEYLTSEVLDLSGMAAQAAKRKVIQPRHVQLAINEDEELAKLLNGVMMARGGVTPFIHVELLPKKHTASRGERSPSTKTRPATKQASRAKEPKKKVKESRIIQQTADIVPDELDQREVTKASGKFQNFGLFYPKL
jgi:histone H2A